MQCIILFVIYFGDDKTNCSDNYIKELNFFTKNNKFLPFLFDAFRLFYFTLNSFSVKLLISYYRNLYFDLFYY